MRHFHLKQPDQVALLYELEQLNQKFEQDMRLLHQKYQEDYLKVREQLRFSLGIPVWPEGALIASYLDLGFGVVTLPGPEEVANAQGTTIT